MCFTLVRPITQVKQYSDTNITPETEKVRDRAMEILTRWLVWKSHREKPIRLRLI